MPNMMSWWEMVGRTVTVAQGPLAGVEGVIQDATGDRLELARSRCGEVQTLFVHGRDVSPPLEADEVMSDSRSAWFGKEEQN